MLSDLITIDNTCTYDPFIRCYCSFKSTSTCHITALNIFSLDVAVEIPDALWNLLISPICVVSTANNGGFTSIRTRELLLVADSFGFRRHIQFL